MAYQVWSVVFGEQPSAAKWNILGSNDASFADGTGISAGVIGSSKIDLTTFANGTDANGWVKTTNIWGKKVYSKKVSQAISLTAGTSFANYTIASPPVDVGTNITSYYCTFTALIATGFRHVAVNFMGDTTTIQIGCTNLFTGGTVSTTVTATLIITEP